MATKKREIKRTGFREVCGIVLLAASVLGFLAHLSYDPAEISLLQSPPHTPAGNYVGAAGAWGAFVAFMSVGVAAYLLPFMMAAMGVLMVVSRAPRVLYRLLWCLVAVIALVCIAELQADLWSPVVAKLNLGSAGGVLGNLLGQGLLIKFLGPIGTGILCTAMLLVSLVYLFEISPAQVAALVTTGAGGLFNKAGEAIDARRDRQQQLEKEEKEVAKQRRRLEKSVRQQEPAPAPAPQAKPVYARTVDDTPKPEPKPKPASAPAPARRRRPAFSRPRSGRHTPRRRASPRAPS